MADAEQATMVNKVRKLRKKLRQIENLQRLCGIRELTDEEAAKVNHRDKIREELHELLFKAPEEEQAMQPLADEATNLFDNDNTVAQEKAQAQQEDLIEQKFENGEHIDHERDATMEPENENQESSETKSDSLSAEEHQHNVNETDDKKVEKAVKKKGSKRKMDNPKYWKEMKFSVRIIQGHHHPLCAVDFNEEHILSGGYDTSLKIWNGNNYEEIFSLGGHTGGISAMLLISADKVVTGSQDCSIIFWDVKEGKNLSSVYVYNPVTCLAQNRNGMLAIGNEGGKIDIYNLEKETITITSKVFDDPLVSCVFMDDGKLVCASAEGIVRTYELGSGELVQISDTYDDITSTTLFKGDMNTADTPNTSMLNLPIRNINCITTFNDTIFWGDDGYNVKAYRLASGNVVKLRNNLTDYSPTDAMAVLKDGNDGYLFCAGFEIDTGCGYINVRKLPEMDYLGTISDETLGYVKCISASVVDGKIRLVTGGSELRVWNETSNGKKRRASDELADVIQCKFVCTYNNACDSEEEEEMSESEAENDDQAPDTSSIEKKEEKSSWCVIQ